MPLLSPRLARASAAALPVTKTPIFFWRTQAGDKVLAVNGILTNDLATIDEVAALFRFAPGQELKLDVASGDAMPFVVRLQFPAASSSNSTLDEEKAHDLKPAVEAMPKAPEAASPKAPEAASWGMTLVLKEYLDLLYQFPDGLYQQTLTRELGACCDAKPDRFCYIGFEEGTEAGTVLVHVNVRPPAANDQDERSAMDLSHAIGEQVEDASSPLSRGVITRKILHVGLHLPLKKLGDDIVPKVTPRDNEEDDSVQSLHSMIDYVRKTVSQREGTALDNSKSTRILSPGGQVYESNDLPKRSEKAEKPGRVSSSRCSLTAILLYGIAPMVLVALIPSSLRVCLAAGIERRKNSCRLCISRCSRMRCRP